MQKTKSKHKNKLYLKTKGKKADNKRQQWEEKKKVNYNSFPFHIEIIDKNINH